ncbi:MAG: hypothetical protein ACHQ9S_01495 [Candidatus Binatia bacterium]
MTLPGRVAAGDDFTSPVGTPPEPRQAGLDAWLRRQVRRQQRVVTLEDALLGNRERAYAVYRLRFFVLRCLSSAALHILRLSVLRVVFPHQPFFLATLVLYAVASLVGSFWWGALEVLRGRVRRLARDAQGRHIPGEIGRWLVTAVFLAVLSLLFPASWVTWQLVGHGRAFNVLQLYVLVIGIRLGLDLVTLTFHSGIYAVRRVYRPLPVMMTVELVGFVLVLALWRWLGPWSFPIAMLSSGVLSTMFLVHYSARLYRLFGWFPLRLERPAKSHLPHWRTVWESLAAGAAYALMKMDAFLMLAVFRWHTDATHDVSLFMLFVSVGPAVQAGFDWAQLLYFDLKRLNARCVAELRRRYEKFAFRLAWLVGIVLWGLACLLAAVITRRNLGDLYWFLGPFLVARSLLAQAQIRAFSKQRYGVLLSSGALLLAIILVLQAGSPTERTKLLGVAAASLLITWLLEVMLQRGQDESSDTSVLPVAEWLERFSQVREPVRVRSLRFSSSAEPLLGRTRSIKEWVVENRWRHRRMAQRVGKQLRGGGAVTVVYPGQVTWYETTRVAPPINVQTLLSWGGGLVDSIAGSPFEGNGLAALHLAQQTGVVGGLLGRTRCRPEAALQVDQVRFAFRKMVPEGTIYCSDRPIPPLLRTAAWKDRRFIFLEAVHFAKHFHASTRRCRFDVTSFSSRGELRLIFVVDRTCDRRRRTRWRQFITRTSVAAAFTDPGWSPTAGAP